MQLAAERAEMASTHDTPVTEQLQPRGNAGRNTYHQHRCSVAVGGCAGREEAWRPPMLYTRQVARRSKFAYMSV